MVANAMLSEAVTRHNNNKRRKGEEVEDCELWTVGCCDCVQTLRDPSSVDVASRLDDFFSILGADGFTLSEHSKMLSQLKRYNLTNLQIFLSAR